MGTRIMARKYSAKPKAVYTGRHWRIFRFLSAHPTGVLSTVTPDGDPHGAVIYFTIDRSLHICFLTKDRTRKFDNIVHNNHVMLTVYDAATQTTAQVTGIASEIRDTVAVHSVADAVLGACLATSDIGTPPLNKLESGEYVGCKIMPVQIRMATYSNTSSGDYADLFESVGSFDLEPT